MPKYNFKRPSLVLATNTTPLDVKCDLEVTRTHFSCFNINNNEHKEQNFLESHTVATTPLPSNFSIEIREPEHQRRSLSLSSSLLSFSKEGQTGQRVHLFECWLTICDASFMAALLHHCIMHHALDEMRCKS